MTDKTPTKPSTDVSASTNLANVDAAFDAALAADDGTSAADHGTQTDLLALDKNAKVTPPAVQTGAIRPPLIGEPSENLTVENLVDHSTPLTAQEQEDAVKDNSSKK